MIIGVDFDNTIVSYDLLMRSIATAWGVPVGVAVGDKKQIRDTLRSLPEGELMWQRLQIAAYGTRMDEAAPAQGVKEFFLECKQRSIPVRIVSHKTVYPNLGEQKVDLRAAAMTWLLKHGFVADDGFGVARTDVYFESTRDAKIARIRQLGITHFIDDLEETFMDPAFPAQVRKVLFASAPPAASSIPAFATWEQIRNHLLPAMERARHAGNVSR